MNEKTLSLKNLLTLAKTNTTIARDLNNSVRALAYASLRTLAHKSGASYMYKLLSGENGVITIDDVKQEMLLHLIATAETSKIFVTISTPEKTLNNYGRALKTIDDARQAAAAKITALKAVKKATADADEKKAIDRRINYLSALIAEKNADFTMVIDAIQSNALYLFFPNETEICDLFKVASRLLHQKQYYEIEEDENGEKIRKMKTYYRVNDDELYNIPALDDVSEYDIQSFINRANFTPLQKAILTALYNGYNIKDIAKAAKKSNITIFKQIEIIRRKFVKFYI